MRYNRYNRKKNNGLKIFIALIILLGVASYYIYNSNYFERVPPKITIKDDLYWNLKNPIDVKVSDNVGISFVNVFIESNNKKINLKREVFQNPQKEVNLKLTFPKIGFFANNSNVKLTIEAVDTSKWHYFNGNKSIKETVVTIDTTAPKLQNIAASNTIKRGGSAVAIVKIKEDNLKEKYILFNENKFKLTPFIKENYYIALIAWDVNIPFEAFKRVKLVAIDKAGNKSVLKVPFYIERLKVKKDNINISKRFIENVAVRVLERMGKEIPSDPVKIFLALNKDLRSENVQTLRKVGLSSVPDELAYDLRIKPFSRLRGSVKKAGFGELRSYYFNGKKIDQEWHLGIDFAKVRKTPIKVSNPGKVIFKDYLGIYGNTIIIDHGLGLNSLYAHTSEQFVELDEYVVRGQKIATTGTSGAVLGDHLHFGILVQGIEVDPTEWMDSYWIKSHILNIIDTAKKLIERIK